MRAHSASPWASRPGPGRRRRCQGSPWLTPVRVVDREPGAGRRRGRAARPHPTAQRARVDHAAFDIGVRARAGIAAPVLGTRRNAAPRAALDGETVRAHRSGRGRLLDARGARVVARRRGLACVGRGIDLGLVRRLCTGVETMLDRRRRRRVAAAEERGVEKREDGDGEQSDAADWHQGRREEVRHRTGRQDVHGDPSRELVLTAPRTSGREAHDTARARAAPARASRPRDRDRRRLRRARGRPPRGFGAMGWRGQRCAARRPRRSQRTHAPRRPPRPARGASSLPPARRQTHDVRRRRRLAAAAGASARISRRSATSSTMSSSDAFPMAAVTRPIAASSWRIWTSIAATVGHGVGHLRRSTGEGAGSETGTLSAT